MRRSPPRPATIDRTCMDIQYQGQKRTRPKSGSRGKSHVQGREDEWLGGKPTLGGGKVAVCRPLRVFGVGRSLQPFKPFDFLNQPTSMGTKTVSSPRRTSRATLPFAWSAALRRSSTLFTGLPFTAV